MTIHNEADYASLARDHFQMVLEGTLPEVASARLQRAAKAAGMCPCECDAYLMEYLLNAGKA